MPSSAFRSPRAWLIGLVVLLLIAALCWKFWPAPPAGEGAKEQASQHGGRRGGGPNGMARPRPGFGDSNAAVPVRVVAAVKGDFPVYYKALGTVTALNTVNVRSRVAGELVKINFKEGQKVKAGDLLAEIDPRAYRIALAQAEGTLAQNQAQLSNARVDLVRYRDLFAQDSIAKQTLDTQVALVGQYEGTVKTNQAAVDDAKLNLDYALIRSPIAGRVGLRQLDLGNLVAANDTTALAIVTQTQPISVVFTLPESELDPVLARYREHAALKAEAWDRGDRQQQAEGQLDSVDNQIDTTTGTLKFKARFANTDERLYPNQFVNVRLLVDTLHNVILAPSAAIQFGNEGTFAYVVGSDDKVTLKKLTVGRSDADRTVVTAGLAEGDRIVLEGTDRLREGSKVEIVKDSRDVPASPGQHLQGQDKATDKDARAKDDA